MRKKIVRYSIIFVLASLMLVGFVFVLQGTKVEAYTPNEFSGSIFENASEDAYSDVVSSDVARPNQTVVIDATSNYNFVDTEFNDQVKETTLEGKTGLEIPETGELTYTVQVPEAGYYNMKIEYYNIEGRNSSICRGIKINGNYPFTEAKSITLSRVWVDEFDVSERRKPGNHDVKPSEKEKNKWNEEIVRDTTGYYGSSFLFYFEQGENELTFVAETEPVVFSKITLFQEKTIPTYKDAYNSYLAQGLQKQSEGEVAYKLQAESTYEKSSPSLCPVANYTSFKVEPYEKFITRYNTIGGVNWDITGDWIRWEIDVPEDGLYQISMKALQNYNHGQESSRILSINGEIPFEECKDISFKYNGDWQNVTFGNDEGAYWFSLKKGKNILQLENTIGKYGSTVKVVDEVIADLNWIYRKVIMRTGVNPSKYHDFQLKENITGLYDKINNCIDNLTYAINRVIEISGERSDLISSLERTKYQLETFVESEKKLQVGLDELETNITSLGTWITTVTSQPLSIDYIMIHGENTKLPKATTNFFQKLWNELVLLIGSYKADTSLKSSISTDGPTIEVWIMSGKDQSNLLRQLIDESFTLQNGVNVDLKLVSSSVLLPATLSGNGPDIAIGVGQNIPVNWGIRNSVVDLSIFDDYEEVASHFYDSAITPFEFNHSVYALPDTQDFLIQFVRTDIFQELGLTDSSGKVITPTNWSEVIDLLPVLQRQYLDYYLPNVTGALSPLMYAMVVQYGGSLYLNNGAESGMMQDSSAQAFYDFVNFYRNYGFAIDANFTNRFRTGEMPIGVTNFTLYNTLAVSAPEIRGNWEFALLPGHEEEDGSTTYATTSSSTGTVIFSSTKELDASWKFVKWWLGEDAQSGYATGIEAILGAAARYPTANKEAFRNLPWSAKDYRILEVQRSYAVGVPIVPGDYIVGRYIDNAFRKVINDAINPNDSLFTYYQKINIELERKRKEFNLD